MIRGSLQSSPRVVPSFHLLRSISELVFLETFYFTTSSQTLMNPIYTYKTVHVIRTRHAMSLNGLREVVSSHKFQIPGLSVRQTVSISSYLEALTKPHNCVGNVLLLSKFHHEEIEMLSQLICIVLKH